MGNEINKPEFALSPFKNLQEDSNAIYSLLKDIQTWKSDPLREDEISEYIDGFSQTKSECFAIHWLKVWAQIGWMYVDLLHALDYAQNPNLEDEDGINIDTMIAKLQANVASIKRLN